MIFAAYSSSIAVASALRVLCKLVSENRKIQEKEREKTHLFLQVPNVCGNVQSYNFKKLI